MADSRTLAAENRRGIAYMCAAMSCFVVNDALVKFTSQHLPSTQLIFLRGLMATALVAAIGRWMGQRNTFVGLGHRRVLQRSLIEACGSMIYLISLFHLPLANATAINLAAPLVITILAVLIYKERVGLPRWLAVAFGFGGVLLIIQPKTSGFNAYAWLCLVGTLFHSARDLITRQIPKQVPSICITLASAVAVTLLAGGLSVFEGWAQVSAMDWACLGLASAFLSVGYFCIVSSMRHGEVTTVAPFRYIGLLVALVLGFGVWGDMPNAMAWAGIVLLVASGWYLLHAAKPAPSSD